MPTSARKKRNRYKLGRERDGKAKAKTQTRLSKFAGQPDPMNATDDALLEDTNPQPQAADTDDKHEDRYYPYKNGTSLKIDFYPEPPDSSGIPNAACTPPIRLTVNIVKTFSTTLSCALLVSIHPKQFETTSIPNPLFPSKGVLSSSSGTSDRLAVLKLCDRRFSRGVREDYYAKPWTPEIEEALREYERLDDDERPEASIEEGNDSWHYEGRYAQDGEEHRAGQNLNYDDGEHENYTAKSKSSAKRKSRSTNRSGKCTSRPIRVVPEQWTDGHREAYIQKKCDRHCETEVSIYRHLRSSQGRHIPLLYGTVETSASLNDVPWKERHTTHRIRGLLMEYIHPAFPLRETPTHVLDQTRWQEIGDTAVRIVQIVGDHGVLNQDVRLDNLLILPIEEGYRELNDSSEQMDEDEEEFFPDSRESLEDGKLRFFKAVLIDFGLARLRRGSESDEEWRKARLSQDEEGAIGYVFENLLWRRVTALTNKEPDEKPFKYRPSERLRRSWDNDEEDM